jgi:hypothetical protein
LLRLLVQGQDHSIQRLREAWRARWDAVMALYGLSSIERSRGSS